MQTIDRQLPALLHIDGESAFRPLCVLYIEVHHRGHRKMDVHGK